MKREELVFETKVKNCLSFILQKWFVQNLITGSEMFIVIKLFYNYKIAD